jgi:hypothetical protein
MSRKTCLSVWGVMPLKDNGNKKIIVSFKRTFKFISKILLQMFHIKLINSWNILTERNEPSVILDDWGYVCFVTCGVTQVFILTASDLYKSETRIWLLLQTLRVSFVRLTSLPTSSKRQLMRLRMNPRWRTAHFFQSKYFKRWAWYIKKLKQILEIILTVLSNETITIFVAIVL